MALPISDRLKALLANTVKTPQLILEIDGLPTFSSVPAQTYPVYGGPIVYGQPGLTYGGVVTDPSILPYIDVASSTNQISQQLLTDKGGFSSTTSFEIALVDKNEMVTELVSPGFVIEEILSRKAKIYLSVQGAAHPQESVLFFTGIVSDVSAKAGLIKINISSPEKLKNQDLFSKFSTELTANLLSGDTTINLTDTSEFILPADAGTLTSYVRIDDELISYTGKTATTLTGCQRGQLNTIAANHDLGANVESFYRLRGNLRDLALKLMLSGDQTPYLEEQEILAFNSYNSLNAANSVFISIYNATNTIGVVPGDTLTIDGSTSNDGVYTVVSVTDFTLGSYITVDAPLVSEVAAGTISLKSKYDVLPLGAGLFMKPDQVDIPQFERIFTQFGASFFEYDFYIKDQINGTEFINTQILYPSGCYALPRKAKTSLGLMVPPLAQSGTKKLDGLNIVGASGIDVKRSISRNFYNSVVYKFDPDSIEDRYLRGKIRLSADSTNRIKVQNKPLTIEADGVRDSGNFEFIFDTQARRFLDRYKFAAESFECNVLFGLGFGLEIGDTIIFDGTNLNVTDSTTGTRSFAPRLFEIQNKSYSLTGRSVKLTLVDTVYSLSLRYGVIAPSSTVSAASTQSRIVLNESYSDAVLGLPAGAKWLNYLKERVLIRSKDWTFSEEVQIDSFDPGNPAAINITPPLSIVPYEGLIFDTIKYPTNTDPLDSALIKAQHGFTSNQVAVVSGVSILSFNVDISDAPDIRTGAELQIHNEDYSIVSNKVKVASVVGTLVTVDSTLGFVPAVGQFIEYLDFADRGKPYASL
jgi:hypothetical protein